MNNKRIIPHITEFDPATTPGNILADVIFARCFCEDGMVFVGIRAHAKVPAMGKTSLLRQPETLMVSGCTGVGRAL